MAITVDDLITEVQNLAAKRDALGAAHDQTVQAHAHVTDVTVTEQANIDAASAQYDKNVTAAKADAISADSIEAAAADDEQAAFDKLSTDLAAFKSGQ